MSRPQYEDWLFDRAGLTPQQALELEQAIARQPDLKRLADAWLQLERELQAPVHAEPAPGFSRRWRARLVQSQQRAHRRQSVMAFGVALGGALAMLLLAALGLLGAPASFVHHWVSQVASLARGIELSFGLLEALAGGLPLLLRASIAVTLTVTLGWVSALWLASLYRYAYQETVLNGGRS